MGQSSLIKKIGPLPCLKFLDHIKNAESVHIVASLWLTLPHRMVISKTCKNSKYRNKISHVKEKIRMDWKMEKIIRMDRHKIDATKY